MTQLEKLLEIKNELVRFDKKLTIAIKASRENKGYGFDGCIIGTRVNGSLKRAGLDLKEVLTKLL